MGGRGSSSGISDKGKPYGTEYTTLYQSGNIKFVTPNDANNTAPLETMTKGRIYVNVNKNTNELKSISFYDKVNKRFKQIDLDHYHKIDGKAEKPHTQYGYYHDGKATKLTQDERNIVDKVVKAWYYNNKK